MNSSTEKKSFSVFFMGQDFIYMSEKFHLSQSCYSGFCINIQNFGQLTCKYYFSAFRNTGCFFDWSALKMTKSQPLKEFSELVLPKRRLRMKKV